MTDQAPAAGKEGILLIGHGSRSEAGVAQFWEFASILRARADVEVACGLIEFAKPTLDEAIDALVAGGATGIAAVPLVLLGAGHMKDDGPAALARARTRHEAVTFSYARDLGVHPVILDLVAGRARDALSAFDQPRNQAVVLVGRGSTDPDANSDLYKAARLLGDGRHLTPGSSPESRGGDLDEIQPAFVSLARPSVAEALDRAATLGAEQIAVVPYFLFTGVLVDRIGIEARAWAATRGNVAIRLAKEIGAAPPIADLVLDRCEEARRGDAHMNCDACIYRTPLPGYESRVGAPIAGAPSA